MFSDWQVGTNSLFLGWPFWPVFRPSFQFFLRFVESVLLPGAK